MKSGAPDFDCEDGYPTDAWLDAMRAYEFGPNAAAIFLVDDLPIVAKSISCMRVTVEDGQARITEEPAKLIEYITGGWSGAEDLIGVMLSHFWIRHFHCKWLSGGAFYFEVPVHFLNLHVPKIRSGT